MGRHCRAIHEDHKQRGVHGVIATMLVKVQKLRGTADLEACTVEFRYSGCIRQGTVEAPTLWLKLMKYTLCENIETTERANFDGGQPRTRTEEGDRDGQDHHLPVFEKSGDPGHAFQSSGREIVWKYELRKAQQRVSRKHTFTEASR